MAAAMTSQEVRDFVQASLIEERRAVEGRVVTYVQTEITKLSDTLGMTIGEAKQWIG